MAVFELFNFKICFTKQKSQTRVLLPESDLLYKLRSLDKWVENDDITRVHAQDALNKYKSYEFWKGSSYGLFIDMFRNNLLDSPARMLDVGCHVGTLPLVLKGENLWQAVNYTGVDINNVFIELAEKGNADAKFFLCDIQKELPKDEYDVVFSRSVISSTFDPASTLRNILSVGAKYVVLLETNLFSANTKSEHAMMIVTDPNHSYTYNVLKKEVYFRIINDFGYIVHKQEVVSKSLYVHHLGKYQIFSHILKKK